MAQAGSWAWKFTDYGALRLLTSGRISLVLENPTPLPSIVAQSLRKKAHAPLRHVRTLGGDVKP